MLKISNLVSSYMRDDGGDGGENLRALEKKIFANEHDLVYIGSLTRFDGGISTGRSLFNDTFTNQYSISRGMIEEQIRKNADDFESCFLLNNVVMNISPDIGHPMSVIGVPLVSEGASVADTVIVICMSMIHYVDAFRTEGILDTTIVSNTGHVLASNDASLILNNADISSLPIVQMMLKSPIDNGQSRYHTGDGIEYLGSYKKIPFGGIGIIASVEADKAFSAVRTTLYRNILILVIVLNIAIIIVYFFSKTITGPIFRLVNVMKKVEQGDFSYQIKRIPRDEMGILMNSFNMMNRGLGEREKIKSAFGKLVSKDIAERVMNEEIKLGGERTEVTILFSDIRSFTAMSENMNPEDVVSFLNEYLTEMVGTINETGGVVDKFIGDAIMAVWGTPVTRDDDTVRAVDCALLMRRSLVAFNRKRKTASLPPIHIGCGLNTGTVLAGQIGSQDRMEYTVIGDAVNLASRIESLNKPFGTDILISNDTYTLVKDTFAVAKMNPIMVKGKKEKIQIWAVLGRLDDPDRPESVSELQAMLGIDPDKTSFFDEQGNEKKYTVARKKTVKKSGRNSG
ncbi:MAG: adenylate/guanylate cyclase domain-containing protein [Spirochaetota bacterium]